MRDLLAETILKVRAKRVYKEIPKYPFVTRDLSLVVANDIKASQIDLAIKQFNCKYIKSFRLFDFYPLKDKKSLTYNLEYLNPDKTLTDEDVNKYQEELISLLHKKLNASYGY